MRYLKDLLSASDRYLNFIMKIKRFKSISTLINETEQLLRQTLQTPRAIMLSGGSTPYVIYNQLAATPCPVHPEQTLFLSDERMVPADSPKNNFNNLKPMLTALNCEAQTLRVQTDLPIETAAEQYSKQLQMLQNINLGFLGMGDDGHTAGFFTPEQAAQKEGALTLYTDRPDGMQGVSVTPALLHRVQRIILLVTGESKRKIIETLLNAPSTIPAGIALTDHPNVELWTDVN